MRKILFVLLCSLLTAQVFGYNFKDDDSGLCFNITSNKEPYTVSVTYENSNNNYENNYKGLTTATIPEAVTYSGKTYSVTSIDYNAFYGCSGLTSVNIPNSVTSIGNGAFLGCSGLTSVTIPNSVTSIDVHAFRGCSGLTSVNIPNSVTEIGSFAFYDCSGLTSVNIPNSVTEIGSFAFYDCSGLTSVTIPNSVTSIGERTFSGCSGLTKVNAESIDGWLSISFNNQYSNPLSYAHHLYVGDKEVTELVIPNSVTSIGNYAFYGCSGLTLVMEATTPPTLGESAVNDALVLIPQGTISAYQEKWGSNKTYIEGEVKLTVNVETPGTLAEEIVRSGAKLNKVTDLTVTGTLNGEDYGTMRSSMLSLCHLDLSGVTDSSIPSGAFSGKETLLSVALPDSVKTIGSNAFYGCVRLPSIDILNNVETIGYGAFSGCTGLVSVDISNSVTSIGERAFSGCSGLTKVNAESIEGWLSISFNDHDSNPLYYAHHLYVGDKEVTELVIPNSVTSIDVHAFRGCSGLTSVNIPNSVTEIGSFAFYDCSGLTSVDIPNSVTSIGVSAFYGCSGLTSVNIPNSVTSIGARAFCDCSGLDSISIGYGMKNISYDAFSGCTKLDKITLLALVPPTVNASEFSTIKPESCKLDVPKSAVFAYATSPVWSAFNYDDISIPVNVNLVDSVSAVGIVEGGGTFEFGTEATLTATPTEGYHFAKWSDGNVENPRKFVVLDSMNIYAVFEINMYTFNLTQNIVVAGSVSGTSTYAHGTNVVIEAVSNTGYYFSMWSDSVKTNPRSIVAKADLNLQALFAPYQYSITLSAENGTVAGAGTYNYGDTITISATPNTGYYFTQWSDGNTENPRNVVVSCDTSLTAIFAINSYSITLSAENGTVTGAGTYNYGDTISISATPNEGYHFTQWSDGNVENPRTITVSEDLELAAMFEMNTDIASSAVTAVNIYATSNTIIVENATADIYVYDTMGRLVARRDIACNVSIAMPREGIYIVKCGAEVKRIYLGFRN